MEKMYDVLKLGEILSDSGKLPINKDGLFEGKLSNLNYLIDAEATMQDDRVIKILNYCRTAQKRDDIQALVKLSNRDYFRKDVLNPLLDEGLLKLTIPDKPNSPSQKYVITRKGLEML